MDIAALVAAAALAVIALFQLALALGAPWGGVAWGGTHPGTLPVGLRIASGIAGAVVYPMLILVVLEAGGRIVVSWLPDDTTLLLWVLAGFFLLGTVMNLVSRSKPERIWGPVSLVVAVCCALLAAQA